MVFWVAEVGGGVVLGEFTDCEDAAAGYSAMEVVEERLARWGVPVAAGFPAGHGVRCRSLPLGVEVRLGEGRLDVVEPPWGP